MGKRNTVISKETNPLFSNINAYSVNEILAAGGTTAFANKLGKNFQNIEDRFKQLPSDAFLTEADFEAAMKILDEKK